MRYQEHLTVPWTWWLPALAVVGALALQLGGTVATVEPWLPTALSLPVAAAALWWGGRLRVAVTTEELQVDDARLPREVIDSVIPLDGSTRRELLGPHADPMAFVVQRPWVRGAVQVVLNDPADPTPYWLVSSHAPERLAAALEPDPARRDG